MCLCVSLLGGFAIPLYRFGLVFIDPDTLSIVPPQIALRLCVSLLCGFAIPPYRFSIVFGNSCTAGITKPQIVLRFRISLFCGFAVLFYILFCIGMADPYATGKHNNDGKDYAIHNSPLVQVI